MAIGTSTIIHDSVLFIRNLLLNNVTDPETSARSGNEKFVMTGYPEREVRYPIITVTHTAGSAARLGMNTEDMMHTVNLEVRVWARNMKEKDQLTDAVVDKLQTLQRDTTGTVAEGLVHLSVTSMTNVDEPGDGGIKSKIITVVYEVYT